jgi:hypothetical protein
VQAWAGARGETVTEIARVFHFGEPEATHAALNALEQSISVRESQLVVQAANTWWISPELKDGHAVESDAEATRGVAPATSMARELVSSGGASGDGGATEHLPDHDGTPSHMTQLQSDGGDGIARCTRCGAVAAGPCARCGLPMCGDCVVLSEGGASVWAVCHRCDRKGGRSLRSGWVAALFWVLLPIAVLWAVITLVERVFP